MADDLYKERCNDPKAREKWRGSGLVTLESLPAGTVFECIDGTLWKRDCPGRCYTIWCHPWGIDGEPGPFLASSLVLPVNAVAKVEDET